MGGVSYMYDLIYGFKLSIILIILALPMILLVIKSSSVKTDLEKNIQLSRKGLEVIVLENTSRDICDCINNAIDVFNRHNINFNFEE